MNDFMRVHFVVITTLCDLHDDLMLLRFIREIKVKRKEKVVELYDWFYIATYFFLHRKVKRAAQHSIVLTK